MNLPFYVAPEQVMKDRADYARKGIARGRSLVALSYADGIALCAENPSSTLNKISEIYDRIAFAGVGKYNEFDQLRIAGVRHADLKGYTYSRADVDARSLANQYAQILGDIFTHKLKPMEVEILVAEISETPDGDRMFHILYDGTVEDGSTYMALGGKADEITERLSNLYEPELETDDALRCAATALAGDGRDLAPSSLETAILTRTGDRRGFRRIPTTKLAEILPTPPAEASPSPEAKDGEEPAAAAKRREAADEEEDSLQANANDKPPDD